MNARYYDPDTAVFMRPDPAMDGLNHYGYVAGNPIKYTDPTGLGFTGYNQANMTNSKSNCTNTGFSDGGGGGNVVENKTYNIIVSMKKENAKKKGYDYTERANDGWVDATVPISGEDENKKSEDNNSDVFSNENNKNKNDDNNNVIKGGIIIGGVISDGPLPFGDVISVIVTLGIITDLLDSDDDDFFPVPPKNDPWEDTNTETKEPWNPKDFKPQGEEPPPGFWPKVLWGIARILEILDPKGPGG